MNAKLLPIILICTFFAGVIRFVGLAATPPGLNWDESSLGYNAFSLAQTGRDEWSVVAPLLFRAFGDYKLPGYIYLSVAPIAATSLIPETVRFTSALLGTLLVPLMMILTATASKSRRATIIAGLIAVFLPWTWWLSRIGLEGNAALTVCVIGICLWLRSRGRLSYLLLGAAFFGFSLLTYNSYRLISPALIIIFLIPLRRQTVGHLSLKKILLTATTCLLFFIPVVQQFLSGEGSARYRWVELIDSGVIAALEEYRNTSTLPPQLTKLIYNRPAYVVSAAAINFVRHFSPAFLGISGGSNYQFNPPNTGLIYWWLLPVFYVGGVILLVKRRIPVWIIVLLLVSPIPAALTKDAPHTLRASLLAVPISLIASLSLSRLSLHISYKKAISLITLVVAISAALYVSRWSQYRQKYSWSWQDGHAQLARYIKAHYAEYDQIVISKRYGEPHIFLLADLQWPPARYQSDPGLNRYFQTDWYWVDSFDKFLFVNDWDLSSIETQLQKNISTLVVSSPDNPSTVSPFETIVDLSGKPVYFLSHL